MKKIQLGHRLPLLDKSTVLGLIVAAVSISTSLSMGGVSYSEILQPSAALLVLGGTIGAVMIQFPTQSILYALAQLHLVFWNDTLAPTQRIRLLTTLASLARRRGIVTLDAELESIEDTFMRKTFTLAVDGIHPDELRQRMQVDLNMRLDRAELASEVFETAGGLAPTIGILGAVLGLIHVMRMLADIDQVAKGIAASFVATLYGVGAANLLLLPIGGKLRQRAQEVHTLDEMTLDAVVAILCGTGPRALEDSLSGYLLQQPARLLPQAIPK